MKISIVTPTLNADGFLDDCAQSVQSEVSQDIELEHLIVDGGSTDRTLDIAREHNCRIVQEKDDGIFDAANRGYRMATGDIVGFLGADDALVPGAAGALQAWYERRETEWVVGTLRWVDGDGKWLGDIGPPPTWLTPEIYASLGWNCVHHLSTYVTPTLFASLGGFDPGFRYSGDYDFFARALIHGPFARIPDPIAEHRRHGSNASMSLDPRVAREDELVASKYGPSTAAERRRNRLLLRIWLNGMNPRWFAAKMLSRGTDRLTGGTES